MFHLPKGAHALATPTISTTDFGTFSQSAEAEGETLRLRTNFAMPTRQIPAADYARFRHLAELVDSAEARIAEVELP